MSPYIERLFEQKRRAAKIGQDLMDAAAAEDRDLTPEEIEQRDKAFADVSRLNAEMEKAKNYEDLRESADDFRATATPVVERAIGKAPSDLDLFRSMVGNTTSTRAPSAYESRPADNILRGVNTDVALRALQSAGGSAVETSFADFVTVYERTATPMLRSDVVRVLNVNSGAPIVLPRLTADPNHGGTITAEAGGINELDPTISSVQLNAYKFGITTLWSAELDQDNVIGLEDLIAFSIGRELGLDIGASLTTDDGSAKPNGIVNAAGNGGTAAGTSSTSGTYFGPTDIVTFFYSFPEPYRRSGNWMMNGTTLGQLRNARATDGQFIWQPALTAGSPDLILGRPVYENPAMANGSAAKAILFGDTQRYVVQRVIPVRVDTSIHYKFNTDQLAIRVIERVDGDLVDTAAVKYLVNVAI